MNQAILLEESDVSELEDRTVPYVMGIDEAGRGPVLGPMVYGAAYCPVTDKDSIKKHGFADSKTLTHLQREILFEKIRRARTNIGWLVRVLHAEELSTKMLQIRKVNLNALSWEAAASLIHRAIKAGVNITQVYLDTVGAPAKYQAWLQQQFPDLEITVSKKADSLFPVVSAASICAKVIRDHRLKHWKYKEHALETSVDFGSGYPADPLTKAWLRASMDPVFGFPSVLRFSWRTTENLLQKGAADVKWSKYEDEDEEGYGAEAAGAEEEEEGEGEGDDDDEGTPSRRNSRGKKRKVSSGSPYSVGARQGTLLQMQAARNRVPRYRFFTDNGMELVTEL